MNQLLAAEGDSASAAERTQTLAAQLAEATAERDAHAERAESAEAGREAAEAAAAAGTRALEEERAQRAAAQAEVMGLRGEVEQLVGEGRTAADAERLAVEMVSLAVGQSSSSSLRPPPYYGYTYARTHAQTRTHARTNTHTLLHRIAPAGHVLVRVETGTHEKLVCHVQIQRLQQTDADLATERATVDRLKQELDEEKRLRADAGGLPLLSPNRGHRVVLPLSHIHPPLADLVQCPLRDPSSLVHLLYQSMPCFPPSVLRSFLRSLPPTPSTSALSRVLCS